MIWACACLCLVPGRATAERVLRVCADPHNLPFSDDRGQGYENRLAAMLARELGAELRYVWHAQRRGFLRETLNAGLCDVVMSMPPGAGPVATTKPYYRSAYVFVTRASDRWAWRTLDDPRLRKLRIGVQVVGDDYANPPPVEALGARGIVTNVRGYPVYGDYTAPIPLAPVVEAVATREVDVALVWGPLAGYLASRQPIPLQLAVIHPASAREEATFSFPVAVAVRKADLVLRDELQAVLARRADEVGEILAAFSIPQVKTWPPDDRSPPGASGPRR